MHHAHEVSAFFYSGNGKYTSRWLSAEHTLGTLSHKICLVDQSDMKNAQKFSRTSMRRLRVICLEKDAHTSLTQEILVVTLNSRYAFRPIRASFGADSASS